jgi:hypothetical protein
MFTDLKIASVHVALVCVAVGCMTGNASAVTAQLAKKCQALTAKAFPPRVPGNPAAGSAKGTGRSQQDYFNRCVANGGNMDIDTPTRRK